MERRRERGRVTLVQTWERQRRGTKARDPTAETNRGLDWIQPRGRKRRRRTGPGRRKRNTRRSVGLHSIGPVDQERRGESQHVGRIEQENHVRLHFPHVHTAALFEVSRRASAEDECLRFDETGNQVSKEKDEGMRKHEQIGTDVKQNRAMVLHQRTCGTSGERSHRMSTKDS